MIFYWLFAVSAFAQTTVDFEEFPIGTRVAQLYAAQGVHFLDDFPAGGLGSYRASPRIALHPRGDFAGQVLENEQDDCEFSTSADTPFSFWFDEPMSRVTFDLGTVSQVKGGCTCPGFETATISVRDCNGVLLQEFTRLVSASFSASVDYTHSLGLIQRVDVDYGATHCPEAIDNLSFTPSGSVCADTTPPSIVITSHTDNQFVNQSQQTIRGEVVEPGILSSVMVDGVLASFRLGSDGRYYFQASVNLREGNNTIAVIAINGSGLSANASLQLFLGTPVPDGTTLGNFHLTQRGAIHWREIYEADIPMVVGKTALVQVNIALRTALGKPTYATTVRMKVWRRQPDGTDIQMGSFPGTTYSPSVSFFESPSDLAAIKFWIPGYLNTFNQAGDYRFTFEAYVGLNQIGPALRPNNGGYISFVETDPIRLLILPVERASWSSFFDNSDHRRYFYEQLDTVARAYPVRDGITGRRGQAAGLIYDELSPFHLPDGTEATADVDCCGGGGTGPEYAFIDKHPSGVLSFANDEAVTAIINGRTEVIGGRIVDSTLITNRFNPALGVYRPGALFNWPNGRHLRVIDENRNGIIEIEETKLVAAEFFDTQRGEWTDEFLRYQPGETFRYFRDLNGNNNYDMGEPVAPAFQRELNQQKLLSQRLPVRAALTERNKFFSGTSGDYQFGSLWFPDPIFAPNEFKLSPGRAGGNTSFIIVSDLVAMAHELGHNFDLADLGCYVSNEPLGPNSQCNLYFSEDALTVFINGQLRDAKDVTGIMDFSLDPDFEVFTDFSYRTVLRKLETSSSANAASSAVAALIVRDPNLIVVDGLIFDDGRIENMTTSLANGLELTPEAPGSSHTIVFGSGSTDLATVRFAPDAPSEAEPFDLLADIDFNTFQVIADFPANTEWVEVRDHDLTRIHVERTPIAPLVRVDTPVGGESFGPEEDVTISWTISDADSVDHRSSIFYSPTGAGKEAQWSLVAGGVRGNTVQWNTANACGSGRNGVIRVVVSDGFNSGEGESNASFSVASKPPRVVILQPRTGTTFLERQQPIVRGIAHDLESDIDEVIWRVDGIFVSELPEDQLPPLSPGTHILQLEATDPDGNRATDAVTIHILADSDRDGMSDEFEETHGLNPGSANDADADLDGDGLVNFEESVYRSDPEVSDTDKDGFDDGAEVEAESDPLNGQNTPFHTGTFANVLFLNGGGESFKDSLGRLWRPDSAFLTTPTSNLASFSGTVDTSLLADPNVPQEMLLSERWRAGDLNYEIPVTNGVYSVVLYFSENCIACVNSDLGGTGATGTARLFDMTVENQRFNAYNQADAAVPPAGDGQGATFVATEVVFSEVAVTDGVLSVNLIDRGTGNPPENVAIKGMAIFRRAPGSAPFPSSIESINRLEGSFSIVVDPGENLPAYRAGLVTIGLEESIDFQVWAGTTSSGSASGDILFFDVMPEEGSQHFYRAVANW